MKNPISAQFNVAHNDAFLRLGALRPLRRWSSFDVPQRLAKKNAKLFVTSIWNHGPKEKGSDQPTFSIYKDETNKTFWYKFKKPATSDVHPVKKDWMAHWNALNIAFEANIPITGILKDRYSGMCSMGNIYDCGPVRHRESDGSVWLEIHPKGELGCDVGIFNLEEIHGMNSVEDVNKILENEILISAGRSPEDRRARLLIAAELPKRTTVTSTAFIRNPDVVAEVLFIAQGRCQKCGKPAPFVRAANGTPYLEVHHKNPLANGGHDTVKNAIAVCPNCHRAAHYA